MRILQQKGIEYKSHTYEPDATKTGVEIVTSGKSGEHYVFVIPVSKELDLKKKQPELYLKNQFLCYYKKKLLHLTGYVHGGCSPIGMKKHFQQYCKMELINLKPSIFQQEKLAFKSKYLPKIYQRLLNTKLLMYILNKN